MLTYNVSLPRQEWSKIADIYFLEVCPRESTSLCAIQLIF